MSQDNPILIFGKNGQVAGALLKRLGNRSIAVDRSACDFMTARENDFRNILQKYQPAVVINATGYTAVDKAESEQEAANRVNGDAVGYLAKAASALDIPLVHYSTDYVFDGSGTTPWREHDIPSPINAYGLSKLKGEQAVQAAGGRHLIFRISWVYDETGRNFVNTMLRLGAEREELQIVADQFGAPCYAGDVAEATLAALEEALAMTSFPAGIYHMCHAGETSWHGFTEAIFEQARRRALPLKIQRVVAIPTSAYPTPAKRPLNSRLNCEKLSAVFAIKMPHWQDGLERCMDNKNEN